METVTPRADLYAEMTKDTRYTRSRFSPQQAESNKQPSTKTASLYKLMLNYIGEVGWKKHIEILKKNSPC